MHDFLDTWNAGRMHSELADHRDRAAGKATLAWKPGDVSTE